jgi:phage shock protein PspC (stress-responsive transcriptional regulator)
MESRDEDPTTPQAGDPPGDASPREAQAGDSAGGARSHEPPGAPPPTGATTTGGAAGPGEPRRLYRSRDDRMIAGVCGGLARYFRIDPVIVRVAAVALVFAGGAGLLAYLAAWLLVPDEAEGPSGGAGRVATVAGAVLLVLAVATIVPLWGGPFGGWDWSGPFAFLIVLGVAGLGVWWVASGEHPAGSPRDVLRRAGLGLLLLALCGFLAMGGAWATAAGGGTTVAVLVIVAGIWLMAGAFFGGARWLILPAIALALPAGAVSAANIDTDGGIGEREYRPAAASDVRDSYRLGIGRLVVDLRQARLGPGDHPVKVRLGVGEAFVVVAPDVCVASRAKVGAGQVVVFDRRSDGVDVDWQDDRTAPDGTPRLLVDGDIGLGQLVVTDRDPDSLGPDIGHGDLFTGNAACVGGANG